MIFPGGFGTFDELFEALTLIQTRKIRNFPVVLFGSHYWSGLLEWFKAVVLPGGKISDDDFSMFHVTDSPREVIEIMNHSQNSLNEIDKLVSDDIRIPS